MNSHEQNQPAGNDEISSGAETHRQPVTNEYSFIAISVGFILLLFALFVVMFEVDLQYKRLLVYAGVAALFSGIGATAAVKLDFKEKGQVGVASGAAAIAILLSLLIGPDQKPEVPKIRMTYYVNFPDDKPRSPGDLIAAVSVTNDKQGERDLGKVPVSWAPGGNKIKLTLMPLPTQDFITLRIKSIKENKDWTSASVSLVESFMNLNEGK